MLAVVWCRKNRDARRVGVWTCPHVHLEAIVPLLMRANKRLKLITLEQIAEYVPAKLDRDTTSFILDLRTALRFLYASHRVSPEKIVKKKVCSFGFFEPVNVIDLIKRLEAR